MLGEILMAEFRAADNSLIRVRPMQTDDMPLLVEIFGRMGPESRYSRFNESVVNADDARIWEEAENIAQAIGQNSYGLLAFADRPEIENTPVGGVRWVMTGPNVAELAVSVIDEFHGLGIGRKLVELLVQEAEAAGITRLTGTVQSENAAVWAMLRALPYEVHRDQDGAETSIWIDLDPPC